MKPAATEGEETGRELEAAAPASYKAWGERLLESVKDEINEAIDEAVRYAHPLSIAQRPDAEKFARAALGLDGESGR